MKLPVETAPARRNRKWRDRGDGLGDVAELVSSPL
jgi:hypothetical protein